MSLLNRNLNQQEFPGRLFDPGPETHEPGRWYHFSRTNEDWDPGREERVHVGTPQAAMDRAWDTSSSDPGKAHVFKLRAPMENTPSTPLGDVEQMSSEVKDSSRAYYYTNEVEDYGSISASVPSAQQLDLVGSTHHTPSRIDRRVMDSRTTPLARAGGPAVETQQPELPGMPEPPSPFDAMKDWK